MVVRVDLRGGELTGISAKASKNERPFIPTDVAVNDITRRCGRHT